MSTPLAAARPGYPTPIVALHWVTAVLIVAAFATIWIAEELPKGDLRGFLVGQHKSIGVLALVFTVGRLGWRIFSRDAAPPAGTPFMQLAARLGHLALYGLLAAIPALGVSMSWAKGRSVDFFGLYTLPALFGPDRALASMLKEAHEATATALLVLIGIHAAAALLHHYVLKDGTLRRMLPGSREAHA